MSEGSMFLQAVEMIRTDIRELDRKVSIRIDRVEDRAAENTAELAALSARQDRADRDLEAGAADLRTLNTTTTELKAMIESATKQAVVDVAPKSRNVAGWGAVGYGVMALAHGAGAYLWKVWQAWQSIGGVQ